MKSGIYQIRNMINGKVYIGSSKDLKQREYTHFNHLKNNKHCNYYLQKSFNKYGENNFLFEILEICEENSILEVEQKYLDENENKYNIARVAGGGDIYSYLPEEQKEKIREKQSESSKSYYSIQKNRDYKSEITKGKKNPNYNNNWSDEQKQLQSIKIKKYFEDNPETRKILSDNLKTRFENMTEEERNDFSEKRRKVTIGENNPFYGKKHSEESLEKIRNSRAKITEEIKYDDEKYIKYYGKNSKSVIINNKKYISISRASEELNVNYSFLVSRINSNNYPNYRYEGEVKYPKVWWNAKFDNGVNLMCLDRKLLSYYFQVHLETISRWKDKGVPYEKTPLISIDKIVLD